MRDQIWAPVPALAAATMLVSAGLHAGLSLGDRAAPRFVSVSAWSGVLKVLKIGAA